MLEKIPNVRVERAVFGRDVLDADKMTRIDAMAGDINTALNPIDDPARRKATGVLTKMVNDMAAPGEWTCDNAKGLVEAAKDPNRMANRDVAEARLGVLVDATYIAIKYGDNVDLAVALESGSAAEIDRLLPVPLKGLGERVRDMEITNTEIRQILGGLDRKGRVLAAAGDGGRKAMLTNLEGAIMGLSELVGLDEKGDEEVMRVSAYLGAEMGRLQGGPLREQTEDDGEELTARQQYQKDYDNYWKDKSKLEGEIREVSLDELLDAYLFIVAPRERAPQMWEYEVPEFMGGMSRKDWRDLLNFNDGWLGAIYGKQGSNEYNNSIDKMSGGILSMKGLGEESMKKWYENETINLRGVMNHISRELLVPKQVTAKVPEINESTGAVTYKDVTRTIYVFDTVINAEGKEEYVKGSRVEQMVDNISTYKLELAQRLVDAGVVPNLSAAKLSVAMAMDIMEMGGVFSEADGLRKLGWDSDAVRLSQRPERKFSAKVGGGELFAGPWAELANSLSGGDPKKSMELIRDWGIVPELLAGSFLDQKLYIAGGEKTKKTMMEMVYNNEKIPFRALGTDLYFGWRKDHIMPAARMWMYIANKNPLEFSKNREDDTVISQWRVDLYNDINQLRKNGDALLPTSVIAGAIGGSVGLWPVEGPYLRVNSAADVERFDRYSEISVEIIRQLGLRSGEQQILLEKFGVNKDYFVDFNMKMEAYIAMRNVRALEWYKNIARKRILEKRRKR
jgi:hypothetical protein